jgi:hypothetical protein
VTYEEQVNSERGLRWLRQQLLFYRNAYLGILKEEQDIARAYLRLQRLIPGAFDAPLGSSPEEMWAHVEEKLKAALSPAPKAPSPYLATVARLEPDIAMIDAGTFYASAAISLKRSADVLTQLKEQWIQLLLEQSS